MNQKLIDSLRLKHSYFVIQKLTLRRIDSLKLKRLCFAIQRLTSRLKHLPTLIQKLRLTDSLKQKRWYLMTR